MADGRARIGHAAALSGLAFLLHFVWESLQCQTFFVHGTYDATWPAMAVAALGDVVLTWVIYAAVAVLSKRWRWASSPWSWMQIGVLVAAALALGIGVELRALRSGSWAYKEAMIVLPIIGVGAVPLLQLVILSPLVILLGERLAPARAGPDETEAARLRYDRIAPIYDVLEWLMELRFRGWRRELWSLVEGEALLELGVGTGKNLRFRPPGKKLTAIDISERMIRRARRRAERLGADVVLELADAQALPFDDASFDEVVATFLFCSVPDPVVGLREARRVLRPGGRLILLEHVISETPVLRTLMRWLDPIPFHIWGAHINRDTVASVREAGFEDITSRNKSLDIVKLIEARAPNQVSLDATSSSD